MSFEIKLPLFEGPFDLLLFFIERNEIDIYDIPIAKITDDFLAYIEHLEELNIEVASEFILVAATLMRIKARTLLPIEKSENPEDNPEEELMNYLLEYKKYKSVLGSFTEMEKAQLSREKRGNLVEELKQVSELNEVDLEMHNLDLYKLLRVYENVLHRAKKRETPPSHTIVPYPYTVTGQKQYLLNKLNKKHRVSFLETMGEYKSKIAVIFNFLAILELLQNRLINLHLGDGFNNFWIEASPTSEESADLN